MEQIPTQLCKSFNLSRINECNSILFHSIPCTITIHFHLENSSLYSFSLSLFTRIYLHRFYPPFCTHSLLLNIVVSFSTRFFSFIFTKMHRCVSKKLYFIFTEFFLHFHLIPNGRCLYMFFCLFVCLYGVFAIECSIVDDDLHRTWTTKIFMWEQKNNINNMFNSNQTKENDWNVIGNAIDKMIGMFNLIFDKMRKL